MVAMNRANSWARSRSRSTTPTSNPPKCPVTMRYSASSTLTGVIGIRSRLGHSRRRFLRLENGVLTVYSATDDFTDAIASIRISDATVSEDKRRLTVHVRSARRTLVLCFRGQESVFDTWSIALRHATTLKLDNHYKLLDVIGRGHYAGVHAAVDRKTGEHVAVKVIEKRSKDPKARLYARREAETVRLLSHESIVKTIDVFETDTRLFIVMERAAHGNLLRWLAEPGTNRINERNARKLARSLVAAVGHCHSRGVVHRDIKPENILIFDDGTAKLADFGLARTLDEGLCSDEHALSSILGTPAYCSPEVVGKTSYGKPVDIYGCGVVLYIALSGALPFKGSNASEVFAAILKGEVRFPSVRWAMVSDDAKDFVRLLLQVNGKDRPTAVEALAHPWLADAMTRTDSDNSSVTSCPTAYSKGHMGRVASHVESMHRTPSERSDLHTGSQRFGARAMGARVRSMRALSGRQFTRASSGNLKDLENRRARLVSARV